MKRRMFTLRYTIPILLIMYTAIMVMIQLGIPITVDVYGELTYEQEPELEGILGQKWIYLQHKDTMHLPDTKSFETKVNHGVNKKKNHFKKVGNMHIFSSFLDNRKGLAITIKNIVLRKKSNGGENLLCHFRYRNGSVSIVKAKGYEMSENHGRKYGGWIYVCNIPVSLLNEYKRRKTEFSYFSLSTTKSSDLVKKRIDSVTVNSTVTKQSLGLCIPPLFGEISISLFIQFMELWKILGASHFTFYQHEISNSIQKLLNFYQSKEQATVLNWKLPEHLLDKEIWYHGQLLAIQDCLYRNMATYKYLGFVDLDEFVIPSVNYTVLDMIEILKNSGQYQEDDSSGLSFKSAFFAPNQILDTSQPLTFLQLLVRNTILSPKRTKLVVQSQNVIELGIHHVSKHIKRGMSITDVDPEIAKIHHFRSCAINFDPNTKCFPETRDETILKYADDLVHNYKTVIKKTLPLFMPKN